MAHTTHQNYLYYTIFLNTPNTTYAHTSVGHRKQTKKLNKDILMLTVVILFKLFYLFFMAGRSLVETVSELIYTPKTERDYGTLACWGKNSIGKQSEPCLFQVVPAGKYFNWYCETLLLCASSTTALEQLVLLLIHCNVLLLFSERLPSIEL